MRLIFIRHGDPDYTIDSLTGTGKKEARLLAQRMAAEDMTEIYVSPLGRAKDTASYTLALTGRKAIELEWLKEFPVRIRKPYDPEKDSVSWDWIPEEWTGRPGFFDRNKWMDEEEYRAAGVGEEYKRVIREFDALLERHGYAREGEIYKVKNPNKDTLVFFCHFGIICVLLSRLMNVSPVILWHHSVLAPSSFTSLYTEERRRGTAQFRANAIGDTSHLYAAGEKPSFAARFCETYDSEERHD